MVMPKFSKATNSIIRFSLLQVILMLYVPIFVTGSIPTTTSRETIEEAKDWTCSSCNGTNITPADNNNGGAIKRICILCEPSPITYMSGQSSRFRLLLQHLSEHHDNVHLVTAEACHPNPPSECFGKVPIHYTLGFCPPQYSSLTLSFDATFKILRLLCPRSKKKFDLIHVSSPGLLLFGAIWASHLYQIPLVMSYHTHLPVYVRSYCPAPWNRMIEWLLWKMIQLVHSFADVTLVTSQQMAQEFDQHNIPSHVWQKGINTTQFHPDHYDTDMRKSMSNDHPDDLLLVYIGRLAKEKRLKELKTVLEELNRRQIPTRLCIVGSGPEEEKLRSYFKGTPTVLMGRLDGLELSQAFASGDVFCMPSDSETLGFVVLESMASGVPCVAAAAGGLIDLIQDGATGFLVSTGDSMAFVDRIQRLHNDPALHRKLSMAGREETEGWSWYESMEELVGVIYPKAFDNFSHRFHQRAVRWLGSFKKRTAPGRHGIL